MVLSAVDLFAQQPEQDSVQVGLAARYGGDAGLAEDESVIAFTDFESDGWRRQWSGGQRPTVAVVREDQARRFEPLAGQALQLRVEQGGHYGASMEFAFRKHGLEEPEEIYFRYYLRFGDDWDPRQGGKLPGIDGTYGRAGWGGRPSDGRNGWSARGLFDGQKNGKTPIGFYCYHADMKGRYGSHWVWDRQQRGFLENNRWYCIEQQVKMNTPGQNDGILRGWVDGQLAFERTDVRMRDVADLKIESIWINLYHGGTWVAQSEDHLYLDNIVIARGYVGPLQQRGAGSSRAASTATKRAVPQIVVSSRQPEASDTDAGAYGLTRDDYRRIVASVPTIQRAVPVRTVPQSIARGGAVEAAKTVTVVGTTDDYLRFDGGRVLDGRFLTEQDLRSRSAVAVLDAVATDQLFALERPVGAKLMLGGKPLTVVGRLVGDPAAAPETPVQEQRGHVFIPITTMQSWLGDAVTTQDSGVQRTWKMELSEIRITVESFDRLQPTVQIVRRLLQRYHTASDYDVKVSLGN